MDLDQENRWTGITWMFHPEPMGHRNWRYDQTKGSFWSKNGLKQNGLTVYVWRIQDRGIGVSMICETRPCPAKVEPHGDQSPCQRLSSHSLFGVIFRETLSCTAMRQCNKAKNLSASELGVMFIGKIDHHDVWTHKLCECVWMVSSTNRSHTDTSVASITEHHRTYFTSSDLHRGILDNCSDSKCATEQQEEASARMAMTSAALDMIWRNTPPCIATYILFPICCMYGICTNICRKNHLNVAKYAICEAYGFGIYSFYLAFWQWHSIWHVLNIRPGMPASGAGGKLPHLAGGDFLWLNLNRFTTKRTTISQHIPTNKTYPWGKHPKKMWFFLTRFPSSVETKWAESPMAQMADANGSVAFMQTLIDMAGEMAEKIGVSLSVLNQNQFLYIYIYMLQYIF